VSRIRIIVAWGAAESQGEVELHLAEPASLRQALDGAVQLMPSLSSVVSSATAFGVWGRVRSVDHRLREDDRVEIYRALKADPKDARRTNAGSRRSGKM
jgi:putative ubiquitin-RnfH superfamily antitoxin RatB of RatAB toxin-antitoxin module